MEKNDAKKLVIHEDEIEMKSLPGRKLCWMMPKDSSSGNTMTAVNLIRIAPETAISPAHSHTSNEEVVYIVSGSGETYIDGRLYEIKAGSMIFFPRKSVHMVRNTGKEEMKAICFFAPPTTLDDYTFHEDVTF